MLVALALVRERGSSCNSFIVLPGAGEDCNYCRNWFNESNRATFSHGNVAVNRIAVIAPRFWAGVFSMPILVCLFSMVGVLGGHLVAVAQIGVDVGAFWSQMQANVEFADVTNMLIKSFVFGVACKSLLPYLKGTMHRQRLKASATRPLVRW